MVGSVLDSENDRTLDWPRRILRFFKCKTNQAIFRNVGSQSRGSFTFSAKIFYCYPAVTLGTVTESRIRAKRTTNRGSIPEGAGCFVFLKTSRPGLGPAQPRNQWVLDLFPRGLSGRGVKLTTPLPSCAEIKNAWINTSTLSNAFMMWTGTTVLPLLNYISSLLSWIWCGCTLEREVCSGQYFKMIKIHFHTKVVRASLCSHLSVLPIHTRK
jgi:hypothetical protein